MAKSFSDRFVFYARESKMNGKEKRKTGERSRIEDLSREKEIIFFGKLLTKTLFFCRI